MHGSASARVMNRIELLPDVGPERAAANLSLYLAAHSALERASARRSFSAHLTALLGIPAVLCSVLSVAPRTRELALGLFALALVWVVAAFALELRCLGALRRAERGVRVTHPGE